MHKLANLTRLNRNHPDQTDPAGPGPTPAARRRGRGVAPGPPEKIAAAGEAAPEGQRAGEAGSWGGWDSNPRPTDYELSCTLFTYVR